MVLGALNVLAAAAFTVLVMTGAHTVGYILAGLTLIAVAVHGRQGFGLRSRRSCWSRPAC